MQETGAVPIDHRRGLNIVYAFLILWTLFKTFTFKAFTDFIESNFNLKLFLETIILIS